jgi:hypothetical protein
MSEFTQHASVNVTGKSWEEKQLAGPDPAHSVAQASFTTTYAGDIVGESTCGLLICYSPASGGTPIGDPTDPQSLTGPYVGYEHVTATIAGRTGSFVLAASGDHTGGVARTDVTVVPGSATGELAGLRGAGHYAADAMEYTLELDYDFS